MYEIDIFFILNIILKTENNYILSILPDYGFANDNNLDYLEK